FGEDLPAPAYWQWRRWCTTPGFYARDVASGDLPPPQTPPNIPVRLIAFSDDDLIPPKCVARLGGAFGGVTPETITPPQGHKIGHLSAFTRRNAWVWPRLLDE
ncbi:MAG: hypothetical protein AAF218_10945, partial [Pseudomonadota bacterium]